jgi:SAM-dependent methyltransferase
LETSLGWIKALDLDLAAQIIDVGGGASALADDLLDLGYHSITVVDLSGRALALARQRLGPDAGKVHWLEGVITSLPLAASQYDLWHDRAVFHFLTTAPGRQHYREVLVRALRPGGDLIMATFAPEAPPQCSGLPVQRYSAEELSAMLGVEFELLRHKKQMHITPGGVEQMYLYCHFRKSA